MCVPHLQFKATRIMVALAWDKYEHRKALIDDPVEYLIVMAKLKPAIGLGNFLMSHVQFNDDATAAITAPVTEIVGITLKMGMSNRNWMMCSAL